MICSSHCGQYVKIVVTKGKPSVRCVDCGRKSKTIKIVEFQESDDLVEWKFVPVKK